MNAVAPEDLLSVDGFEAPHKKLKINHTPPRPSTAIVPPAGGESVTAPEAPASAASVIRSYQIDGQCSAQVILDTSTGKHRYELIEPSLLASEKAAFDRIVIELHKKPRGELERMKAIGGKERIRQKFESACLRYSADVTLKEKMRYYVERDFWGYKKIDALMKDRNVEDISCNGYRQPVYVYFSGMESIPTNVTFDSEEELDDFVMYLVQKGGKSISAADPIRDVALPDGSRLNGTIYREVSSNGTTFTIRVASRAKSAAELLRRNTFSPESMAFLWLAMENRCSMAFIGGTASGKTAALNAVCGFISDRNKVVTIEDTREVRLASQNWTPLVVRESGDSPISEFDLLVAAFRQRPEYVILGEVRTPEGANTAIHGINSGHTVLMTFHADTPHNFFNRLTNEPFNISPYVAASLSICINLSMVSVPSVNGDTKVRRCRSVSEISGIRDGELAIDTLFEWDPTTDRVVMSTRQSYVLEKIRTDRGWIEERIVEEMSDRTAILRWIATNNITDEEKIRHIIEAFHRDRQALMRSI